MSYNQQPTNETPGNTLPVDPAWLVIEAGRRTTSGLDATNFKEAEQTHEANAQVEALREHDNKPRGRMGAWVHGFLSRKRR